jgi:hypothetical protein
MIKSRLITYQDEKAVQQPEPSFLNENGPIKPDRSRPLIPPIGEALNMA